MKLPSEYVKGNLSTSRSFPSLHKLKSSNSLKNLTQSTEAVFNVMNTTTKLKTSDENIHPLKCVPVPEQFHSPKSLSFSDLLIPLENTRISSSSLVSATFPSTPNDSLKATDSSNLITNDDMPQTISKGAQNSFTLKKYENDSDARVSSNHVSEKNKNSSNSDTKNLSDNASQIQSLDSTSLNTPSNETSLMKNIHSSKIYIPVSTDSKKLSNVDYLKSSDASTSNALKKSTKNTRPQRNTFHLRLGVLNGKEVASKIKTGNIDKAKHKSNAKVEFSVSPTAPLVAPTLSAKPKHTSIEPSGKVNKINFSPIKNIHNTSRIPILLSTSSSSNYKNDLKEQKAVEPNPNSVAKTSFSFSFKKSPKSNSVLSNKYATVPSKVKTYKNSPSASPSHSDRFINGNFDKVLGQNSPKTKNEQVNQRTHQPLPNVKSPSEYQSLLNKNSLEVFKLIKRDDTLTPNSWDNLLSTYLGSKEKIELECVASNTTPSSKLIDSKGELLSAKASVIPENQNTKAFKPIASPPVPVQEHIHNQFLNVKTPHTPSACSNESISTIKIAKRNLDSANSKPNPRSKDVPASSSSLSLQSTISTITTSSSTATLEDYRNSGNNILNTPTQNEFRFSRPTSSSLLKLKPPSHRENNFLRRKEMKKASSSSSIIPSASLPSRTYFFRRSIGKKSVSSILSSNETAVENTSIDTIHQPKLEDDLEDPLEILDRVQQIVHPPSDLIYLSLLLLYILFSFDCLKSFV